MISRKTETAGVTGFGYIIKMYHGNTIKVPVNHPVGFLSVFVSSAIIFSK